MTINPMNAPLITPCIQELLMAPVNQVATDKNHLPLSSPDPQFVEIKHFTLS